MNDQRRGKMNQSKNILAAFVLILSACSTTPVAPTAAPKTEAAAPAADATESHTPKYGSTTIPLSHDHAYFENRSHAAPDFWALIPYYVPQEEHACSAASISMVLNGFKSAKPLKSSDELVRQLPLIQKTNDPNWQKAIASGNCLGLESLTGVLRNVMKIYGYDNAKVEVTHITDQSPKTASLLRKALRENEKSSHDFIIANFIQGILTGDPEGMDSGHVSLVGAYDAKAKRVLILDVDRQWYEPYWVPEALLLKAMNTTDKGSQQFRGFIHVTAE
jgi:hypothetical protein